MDKIDGYFKEIFPNFPYVEENKFEKEFLDKVKTEDAVRHSKGNNNNTRHHHGDEDDDGSGLLLHRLRDPTKGRKINLKELRDSLLDCRASKSVVISWGVSNDGRLGIDVEEEAPGLSTKMDKLNRKYDDDEEEELVTMKPQIIKFPVL